MGVSHGNRLEDVIKVYKHEEMRVPRILGSERPL